MSWRIRWTPELYAQAVAARAAGHTNSEIARAIGAVVGHSVSVDAIQQRLKDPAPEVRTAAAFFAPPRATAPVATPPPIEASGPGWTIAQPPAPEPKRPPAPPPPDVPRGRRAEAYLIIPDTQEPYSAPAALSFVLAVAKEFGIDLTQPGSAYHVGDEVDFYAWSRFPASPERAHTPMGELDALRERLRPWFEAIPHLRLCHSNHGGRIIKAASNAQLPSQLLRAHREILGAPEGWQWAETWTVEGSKQRFMVEHGHAGPGGVAALRTRPTINGISTVWGHLHAQPGIAHVQTLGQRVWGMCVGSLIDRDAVAFEYGRNATWRPVNGCGVVLDGGRLPLWVPYGGAWP